jgi:hypothetical protein
VGFGAAAVAVVVGEEEVQLDLACASGLADGLMEHKTVASVEWLVAGMKQRLVDVSVTCSATVDFVAASYAFDSFEDCIVVAKNGGVVEDVVVVCAVDGAVTVAFAGDAERWIIVDDVAIADVEILGDVFAVAAVLIVAGVEHVDVADDGLVSVVAEEQVVGLAFDVVVANAAFVL